MSRESVSVVWLQSDLRLNDNPALNAAIQSGKKVLLLYIWDEGRRYFSQMGSASKWWLHHSLKSIAVDLEERGLRLQVLKGSSLDIIKELSNKFEIASVYWNQRYEADSYQADAEIRTELKSLGLEINIFSSYSLFEPDAIRNKTGGIYKVFTPFWKRCLEDLSNVEPEALSVIAEKNKYTEKLENSVEIDDLKLLPTISWDTGFYNSWQVGEKEALKSLENFLGNHVSAYKDNRDIPSVRGTSRLSPSLHFGEISPRQVVGKVRKKCNLEGIKGDKGSECYLSEVGWREFSIHLLYHFPDLVKKPLRPEFEKFPWDRDAKKLEAWQRGMTGIPMVDAGMRELWHTGWMHNRVRMIVASFLVKNLQIHWLEGMKWFWDTLVDADLASNTLSWQWVAGCGADASPYFRIFNPVTQGQKFDPDGEYVKKWIPELKAIPKKWVHCPWDADKDLIAYLQLFDHYPKPIVDLKESRKLALEAYETIK